MFTTLIMCCMLVKELRKSIEKDIRAQIELEQRETASKRREEQLRTEIQRSEEIESLAAAMHSRFRREKMGDYSHQCEPQRRAAIECYLKNSQKPLNCSSEVRSFSNCAIAAKEDFLSQLK
eukprot:Opistho-2@17458